MSFDHSMPRLTSKTNLSLNNMSIIRPNVFKKHQSTSTAFVSSNTNPKNG